MEPPEAEEAQAAKLRHIKKKALKSKSLSISFDEKGLRGGEGSSAIVGGVERRKRIDARKKRKLESEYVLNGGVLPTPDAEGDEEDEFLEDDEETEPQLSVSVYDHGDMKVTVTTSEISCEDENNVAVRQLAIKSLGSDELLHAIVPASKKKSFKRVGKQKSFNKSGKKNNKDRHKKRH